MMRYSEDIKRAIEELNKIESELELIDYLRKELPLEYRRVFQEEMEEKIIIAKSKYWKDFDIRKYSLFLLKNEIQKRYKINKYYDWLDVLKVIVFYENILTLLDKFSPDNIERNKKFMKQRMYINFLKI